MNDTTITFRTNKELKLRATKFFKESGITLSDALNSFLSKAVENSPSPFDSDAASDYSYTYPECFFDLFGSDNDPSMTVPERFPEAKDIEDF